MLVRYNDITESEIKALPYSAGNVYYCYDTGNIYMDSVAGAERKRINNDLILIDTVEELNNILAPIPDKMYYVRESATFHMTDTGYAFGSAIGKLIRNPYYINITLDHTEGAGCIFKIKDDRFDVFSRWIFIPDSSVADLIDTSAENMTILNYSGTLMIRLLEGIEYDIPGVVIVF